MSLLSLDTTLLISANIWAYSRKVDKSFASQVASLTPKLTFAKRIMVKEATPRMKGRRRMAKIVQIWPLRCVCSTRNRIFLASQSRLAACAISRNLVHSLKSKSVVWHSVATSSTRNYTGLDFLNLLPIQILNGRSCILSHHVLHCGWTTPDIGFWREGRGGRKSIPDDALLHSCKSDFCAPFADGIRSDSGLTHSLPHW